MAGVPHFRGRGSPFAPWLGSAVVTRLGARHPAPTSVLLERHRQRCVCPDACSALWNSIGGRLAGAGCHPPSPTTESVSNLMYQPTTIPLVVFTALAAAVFVSRL